MLVITQIDNQYSLVIIYTDELGQPYNGAKDINRKKFLSRVHSRARDSILTSTYYKGAPPWWQDGRVNDVMSWHQGSEIVCTVLVSPQYLYSQ